jgi:hypothetical protein
MHLVLTRRKDQRDARLPKDAEMGQASQRVGAAGCVDSDGIGHVDYAPAGIASNANDREVSRLELDADACHRAARSAQRWQNRQTP